LYVLYELYGRSLITQLFALAGREELTTTRLLMTVDRGRRAFTSCKVSNTLRGAFQR